MGPVCHIGCDGLLPGNLLSVSALLTHQMEQRFNLERTLRDEREKLTALRAGVRGLEHKVSQKMLGRLGPLNMRQGDVVSCLSPGQTFPLFIPTLPTLIDVRKHPSMTSAKISKFWTPSFPLSTSGIDLYYKIHATFPTLSTFG